MSTKKTYLSNASLLEEAKKILGLVIKNGAITTDKIKDKAVTTDKLADGAVTSRTIQKGAVNSSHLSDNILDELIGSIGEETQEEVKGLREYVEEQINNVTKQLNNVTEQLSGIANGDNNGSIAYYSVIEDI